MTPQKHRLGQAMGVYALPSVGRARRSQMNLTCDRAYIDHHAFLYIWKLLGIESRKASDLRGRYRRPAV